MKPAAGGPPKILVIDDDPSIRDLLERHLRNAGYDVVLAEDAVAGGRQLLKYRPDLVLLDLDMPYMNGLELLAVLKADHRLSEFRVVFLTANPDHQNQALRMGAVGYLAKPIYLNDLLREVSRHLPDAPMALG
jgi:DNA-binding response OmpR family regulator